MHLSLDVNNHFHSQGSAWASGPGVREDGRKVWVLFVFGVKQRMVQVQPDVINSVSELTSAPTKANQSQETKFISPKFSVH